MHNIIPLFCEIDDFILAFEKYEKKNRLSAPTASDTRGHPEVCSSAKS